MTLTVADAFEIRSNNTWINRSKSTPAPHAIFGEFWREGELALLFAHHGLGKSTLAMQIAESIARGKKPTAMSPAFRRPLPSSPPYEGGVAAASADGVVLSKREEKCPHITRKAPNDRHENESPFPTTAPPQTVLYLDLEMTAKQIELRYSRDGEDGELLKSHHRFSERLKRVEVRPELLAGRGERPVDEILYDLIEPLIRETGARVLIVDNIGCLRRSAYSTRECVRFMKDLHRLKCLHNLSVLVIAASQKSRTPRPLAIADMQSLKSIADHADTVFAIGQSSYDPGERYIKHIRTRNAEIVHSEEHVPVFRLKKIAQNFLGFEFQHFAEEKNLLRTTPREADRETIQKILDLTAEGLPIRAIAEKLEMSKSTIHRLRNAARFFQSVTPDSNESEPEQADDRSSIYDDNPQNATLRREAYLGSKRDRPDGNATVKERASTLPDDQTAIPIDDSSRMLIPIDLKDSIDSPDSRDFLDSSDSPDSKDPILSLPREVDGHGREVYIEKRGPDGRRCVWYFFDKSGVKVRCDRNNNGILCTRLP